MPRTTWRKIRWVGWDKTSVLWPQRWKEEVYNPHRTHSETLWCKYYAKRMLQCIWNWESHQGGRNKKGWYVKIWTENLKQSAAKRGLGDRFVFWRNDPKHTSRSWWRTTSRRSTSEVKALTWMLLKICGVNWRPRSMTGHHHIWRRDSPKKNGLGLLSRRVRDPLKTTANNCRLLSSKKDTQLTVSIRSANNFDLGNVRLF